MVFLQGERGWCKVIDPDYVDLEQNVQIVVINLCSILSREACKSLQELERALYKML